MVKKVSKLIAGSIALFLFGSVLYFFFAVLFSLIPVHKNQNTNKDITIYLRSNGAHIELVLPIKTAAKDWRISFPPNKAIVDKTHYVSFGWGDENFYRNVPQWSDLSFPVAFKALFLKTNSAIRVDYYDVVRPNKWIKQVKINEAQYRAIISYIDSAFKRDANNKPVLIHDLNYSEFDSFYQSRGSYNLFFTCNTWTNRCLKTAGLKACLWTPFDRGILFQYRKE